MSSDNYYFIRYDTEAKEYVVECRFASEDYEENAPFFPRAPRFKTLNEAEVYANTKHAEYGVTYEFPVLAVSLPLVPTDYGKVYPTTLQDLVDIWRERGEHSGTVDAELNRCADELEEFLTKNKFCFICDEPFKTNVAERRVCNVCMNDELAALSQDM